MYRRGGDRGWHQGHHREGFPSRNHQSAPYRGGYQDHREHSNYGQYDHNVCNDRHYDDSQYMEYQEPTYHDYHEDSRPYHEDSRSYHDDNRPYHGENRPYHEHRDPRDQAYHARGRHKDFRGGYQQMHGESGRYYDVSKSQRKKYPYRGFKPQMKECDVRLKPSTAKPVEPVVNPVHGGAPLGSSSQNPNDTKTVPSQDNNVTKPEDNSKKHTPDETKPVQNGAKPVEVSAEPKKEDTKLFSENKKPSEDKAAIPAKEVVKVEHVDPKTENNIHSREPACGTKLSTEMTTQVFCKMEPMEDSKEDIQTLPQIKEEKQEFSITANETQEETFLGKSIRQDEDRFFVNRTVEIPLLGSWADTPSDSIEAAGPSTKRQAEPVVDYGLSHTARELRKAFILAKKEEIELAFSQDCRTFAFVASTLLKKDPSLEVAVSNALRSTLQDIAGRCVQELSRFIDHYDSIPVNISERLQNSDRC